MTSGAAPDPHALGWVEASSDDFDDSSGISIEFIPDSPVAGRPTPPPCSSGRPGLAPGAVVGGHFWLLRRVGSGGMGEVWAAEDTTRHVKVAVKLLLQRTSQVPEIVARFEREALLLGRLSSEHAPRLIEYIIDPVYGPLLVTELVEGQSLLDVIKTPLSIEQAVELAIDLASGLAELHRASVIHRDLKPGNVILRPSSDGKTRAVMIDFGVSRLVHEPDEEIELADITTSDGVVGTVEYMAPEQILCCGQVTESADLYSLGTLLFRAVTGAHVFGPGLDRLELVRTKLTTEAPPLPTDRQDPFARGFVKVLARALERNPRERYSSADELRADLVRLRDLAEKDATRAASPDASAAKPARTTTRGARRYVLSAVMVMTLVAVIIAGSRIGRGDSSASSSVAPPETRSATAAPDRP